MIIFKLKHQNKHAERNHTALKESSIAPEMFVVIMHSTAICCLCPCDIYFNFSTSPTMNFPKLAKVICADGDEKQAGVEAGVEAVC